LDGKDVPSYDSSLNDSAFASGDVSGLGRKTLRIVAPRGEPFQTNFFVWYGGASLGTIKLEHSRGTVELDIVPAAKRVTITGNQFRKEIQNCSRESLSLPIGDYEIETMFNRFTVNRPVAVRRNESHPVRINPDIVSFDISSEPSDAKFRLESRSYKQIEIDGATPATLDHLPIGEYQVSAWRGDYRKTVPLWLTPDPTNRLTVKFDYADVSIRSDPEDASVIEGDNMRGKTPLTLSLAPGGYRFRIEKDGYYTTNIQFALAGTDLRQIGINLVNIAFTEAMANARSAASRVRIDYALAISEVDKALKIRPSDEEALQLRSHLSFGQHVSNAKELRSDGKFSRALIEVDLALKINAGDTDALALKEVLQTDLRVAEEQKLRASEAEARAKVRVAQAEARAKEEARRKLPLEVFAQTLRAKPHHALFNEHAMVVKGSRDAVVEAVIRALSRNPEWNAGRNQTPDSEVEIIQADRKFIGMKYHAVVVVGETADNEVTIYFKIITFIAGGKIEISLSGISGGGYVPYHPQHSSVSPVSIATQVARDVAQFKLRIEQELR